MNPDENTPQKLIIKIIADIVCLLLVGIPILVFYLMGQPFKRGFFCDDTSLRYPYHESTVPSWALYIFGLGLPSIVIIITELALFRYSPREKLILLNRHVPMWIWECYRHISIFGFGALCSQLTTDIAKYSIGRLRPHFFAVCQPNIDCSKLENKYGYFTQYECLGKNKALLKDMKLSFPSGHSSFSMYCMVFLAAYIQGKINFRQGKLFKHVLQFVAISLAVYTCLSRVSDYKHHWSDVLAGAAQGAIVAVLIVIYVSDIFPTKKIKLVDLVNDQDASDNVLKMDERRGFNSRVS